MTWDNSQLQQMVERDRLLREYANLDTPDYTGKIPLGDGVEVDKFYSPERDEFVLRVSKDGESVQAKQERGASKQHTQEMLMKLLAMMLVQLLQRLKEREEKRRQEQEERKQKAQEKREQKQEKRTEDATPEWVKKLRADLTVVFTNHGVGV